MTYTIPGYDAWKTASPDYFDAEIIHCEICSEPYTEDDGYCQNEHCHCQECGEELPEVDDAHCTNCCECDECYEAYQ